MKCDYCEANMTVTRIKVKRPVPDGAKDLGLLDNVVVWKCSKCDQTKTDGIGKCHTCSREGPLVTIQTGQASLSEDDGVLNRVVVGKEFPQVFATNFEHNAGECVNCIKCRACQQPIGDEDFRSWYAAGSGNDSGYFYFRHNRCYAKEREGYQAELQNAAQAVPPFHVAMGVIVGLVIGSIVGLIASVVLGPVAIPLFALIGACVWGWIFVRNRRDILVRDVRKQTEGYEFRGLPKLPF